MQQFEKNSVRPSEPSYILRVSRSDMCLSGSRDRIVFLPESMIAPTIFQDHLMNLCTTWSAPCP